MSVVKEHGEEKDQEFGMLYSEQEWKHILLANQQEEPTNSTLHALLDLGNHDCPVKCHCWPPVHWMLSYSNQIQKKPALIEWSLHLQHISSTEMTPEEAQVTSDDKG